MSRVSVRNNIEDFLCPFKDMFVTQGSNSSFSHKGVMANDVRGVKPVVKYSYFAPCTMKCLKIYPESGQSMWQSVNKVRFANGRIDYATMMIAHDESLDWHVGQVVNQGFQIGNMGAKGNATGVHCHIQISQSNDIRWFKNSYGIYHFNNEYDLDDCYFIDFTNVLNLHSANWRKTTDVKVDDNKIDRDSNVYITKGDMYVRCGPGPKYQIKLVKNLTDDGKKNATSNNLNSYAVYKKGTKFTAKEIYENENGIWAETPSGFVCLKGSSGTVYCEKC